MNLTRVHRNVSLPAFTGDPIYTRPVPAPPVAPVDQEARVLAYIAANPGETATAISTRLGFKLSTWYPIIRRLLDGGRVHCEQPNGYGGAKHYWLPADLLAQGRKPRSGRGRPRKDAEPATGQKSGVCA